MMVIDSSIFLLPDFVVYICHDYQNAVNMSCNILG